MTYREENDLITLSYFYVIFVKLLVHSSNLLICFFSFDLSCPTLEKDNFIENVYNFLSY